MNKPSDDNPQTNRKQRALISTFDPQKPLPKHRVNLATMAAILAYELDLVTSPTALRKLPVTRQLVDGILRLDPKEVIEHYRAKFRDAPVVMHGIPKAPPPPSRHQPARETKVEEAVVPAVTEVYRRLLNRRQRRRGGPPYGI